VYLYDANITENIPLLHPVDIRCRRKKIC